LTYWDSIERHTVLDDLWMSHPRVRERINLRVSGDPGTWTTTWMKSRLQPLLPLGRAVSIGCGVGGFERDMVRQGIVSSITGLDLSETCIRKAVELAREAGYGSQIHYESRDAREWLRTASDLDAVFFHASLHHLDRLDELMGLVRRSLRPGGVLFLDEYVGPSRHEWRLRDLVLHNALYYLLPKSVRRVGRIRAPINHEDPTEAVCSSEIERAVAAHFDIRERRDYGGNLLWILYPNLRRPNQTPGSVPEDFEEAVGFLLDAEDVLLRHPRLTRSRSHFTVILAQPRLTAPGGRAAGSGGGRWRR
jgi:SAM-dependent methyltransferase